jgi:hypothetical protein
MEMVGSCWESGAVGWGLQWYVSSYHHLTRAEYLQQQVPPIHPMLILDFVPLQGKRSQDKHLRPPARQT